MIRVWTIVDAAGRYMEPATCDKGQPEVSAQLTLRKKAYGCVAPAGAERLV